MHYVFKEHFCRLTQEKLMMQGYGTLPHKEDEIIDFLCNPDSSGRRPL